MKLDSEEFAELSKKYSFLSSVKESIERYAYVSPSAGTPLQEGFALAHEQAQNIDKLDIDFRFSVKLANERCLLLQADNVGWNDGSFLQRFPKNGEEPLLGRRMEKALALDENGNILNELLWPKNREERLERKNNRMFSKYVLWGSHSSDYSSFGNPIWDETKFLGWFSCTIWYSDTKDDSENSTRFGKALKCEISLDLHESPPSVENDFGTQSGLEDLYNKCNFFEHLYIDSKILTEGQIDHNHDLVTIGGMIYELAQQFYEDVFAKGIKSVLDQKNVRGASGRVGNVKMLAAECCGYSRIMLEAKVNGEYTWASLQLRPDSKNMQCIGSGGVLPNIRKLIRTTITKWPKYKDRFRPDDKVSVM